MMSASGLELVEEEKNSLKMFNNTNTPILFKSASNMWKAASLRTGGELKCHQSIMACCVEHTWGYGVIGLCYVCGNSRGPL